MPPLTAPAEPGRDARCERHAYLACGQNLYYVLGESDGGLLLEDCLTLQTSTVKRAHVLGECELVHRLAPGQDG